MKKLIKEIIGGILIAIGFTVVTRVLIESSHPQKYLPLYIGFEFIAFMLFSTYGAALIAIVATFVALGTLLIAENWFSMAAIATYWGVIMFLNIYLEDLNQENGKHKLEIEDNENSIGELFVKEREYSNSITTLIEKILRYNKLADFALILSTTFKIEKIYSFVLNYIKKFFPEKKVNLLTTPVDQYDKWVVENKRPLLVKNTGKDFRFSKTEGITFNSLIECPVFQEYEVVSIVKLISSDTSFTPSDLRILNVVSTLSSIALENARLYRRTKDLAITDSLTKLYTHVYFGERLEEEVKRAARYKEKFVTLMIDIDDFKHFNDTYGHPAGDMVLKRVAEAIQETVRETDIVGRYGGEEISVILHNIGTIKAQKIAERIRKSVESQEYEFNNRMTNVTITIGASSFPGSPTAEELIRRADEELYKGKEKGKNMVVFS